MQGLCSAGKEAELCTAARAGAAARHWREEEGGHHLGGVPAPGLDNFTSKLGQRVGNILKYLFPCPKVSSGLATPLALEQNVHACSSLGAMKIG